MAKKSKVLAKPKKNSAAKSKTASKRKPPVLKMVKNLISDLKLGSIIYYPGAGFDFGPLNLFSQNNHVKKIIYCDYSKEFNGEEKRFRIIKMIRRVAGLTISEGPIELNPSEFKYTDWDSFWRNNPRDLQFSNPEHAFALKFRLNRNKKAIDFIYFNTEAIGTYEILIQNKIRPNLIVLQDHGTGSNWDSFAREGSLLYQAAENSLPEFLFIAHNTDIWPGYTQYSEYSLQEGQTGRHKRALFRKS